MMSPYHSMQMSNKHWIWLRSMCWQQTMPNKYIEVKIDVEYFQWFLPLSSGCFIKTQFCNFCPFFFLQKPCKAIFLGWRSFFIFYQLLFWCQRRRKVETRALEKNDEKTTLCRWSRPKSRSCLFRTLWTLNLPRTQMPLIKTGALLLQN